MKIGYLLSLNHLQQVQRFGLYIIYGSLIAGILYLDNCFIQIYGFTLLTLIHNRLTYLMPNFSKEAQGFIQQDAR